MRAGHGAFVDGLRSQLNFAKISMYVKQIKDSFCLYLLYKQDILTQFG